MLFKLSKDREVALIHYNIKSMSPWLLMTLTSPKTPFDITGRIGQTVYQYTDNPWCDPKVAYSHLYLNREVQKEGMRSRVI